MLPSRKKNPNGGQAMVIYTSVMVKLPKMVEYHFLLSLKTLFEKPYPNRRNVYSVM